MNSTMKKPVIIFLGSMLLLLAIFFLFPINVFDGEVVVKRGLQEVIVPHNLSLSNFIGIGYDEYDMMYIEDFYLTGRGYILAFIFTVGIPFLLAYRIYLKQKSA